MPDVKSLCLLLWSASFLPAPTARAQQDPQTMDFAPRAGWHVKGPVSANPDGRICLTNDGRGLVWKTVDLDVDAYPVLLACVTNSLPRERWLIVVEPGDSPSFDPQREIRLIEKFAEEGGFMIPLQKLTGWQGRMQFVIMIVLEGRQGDRIVLDNLEAIRLTTATPAAPKLCDPASDAVVSAPALHFCWHQVLDAVEYELQVSSDPAFTESKSIRVAPPYPADKLPYLPRDEELLGPGRWHWRVRAINLAGQVGAWSAVSTFDVRGLSSPQPRALRIAPEHPLLVLCSDRGHLAEHWKALPAELKPYCVFRIEEILTEPLRAAVRAAQEQQVPILLQVSGPHDYYGRTSSRIPLTEIEALFRDFPAVKGVYLCEQAFRLSPEKNRIMMNYAERLIPLAAAYGRLVVWADAHWGRNLWIDVGLNRNLLEIMQKHAAYWVPVWKMNGSLTPYSAHDAVFGFWAGRAADHWGVQPERWYWYEAGFGKLNEQAWFKEGSMPDFPPTFYAQMILLGLSGGATVYSLEPGDDIWGQEGGPSTISEQVTFPLLREIARHGWIPNREEVLRKIRTVYVADDVDSRWSLDYGSMRHLYEGTYGVRHPFQMLPSTGRYFWIPILPARTPPATLAAFPDWVGATTFSSPQEVTMHFNERYESTDKGDAWVVRISQGVIIMNSRENWDEDQNYEVLLSGAKRRLSGRIGVNSYILARETERQLRLQLNGRAGRSQALKLWTDRQPQPPVVTPPDALVRSSWDPADRCLTLEFSLNQAAITADIAFPAAGAEER